MPRSKVGVKRPAPNADKIKKAVDAILASPAKRISFREASKVYGITIGTLHRHIKRFKQSEAENFIYENKCDIHRVFNDDEDKMLLNYIKLRSRLHYGLTKLSVKQVAYEFAKANKKIFPEQWNYNKQAGRSWLRLFLKKYKSVLALRKPEATSLARSSSFNRYNVESFFKNLAECHTKYGPFPPQNIYNIDESGLSTVHGPSKIIAPKGEKQVGSVTSAERGSNVTLISGINAVGNHVPPMLVFPRVHFKENMLIGAPAGTVGAATPSGWSNDEVFSAYLDHLISYIKPSKQDRMLIILDNHSSHCTLEIIDKAKDNGIILFTFPPHTSHKLQPLDRTVFGSLKAHYNRAVGEWMTTNPGKTFTIYNVASVLGKIYSDAFSTRNIISGFKVSGISPMDQNIFTEDEFLSSTVTKNPLDEPGTTDNQRAEPGPSGIASCATTTPLSSGSSIQTPEEVCPLPKCATRKPVAQRRKKPGKTRVLTDTPERQRLLNERLRKDELKRKPASNKPHIKYKKKLFVAEQSDSESEREIENVSTSDEKESSGDEEEFQTLETYAEGDYVMVKFLGKKNVKHFVGVILSAKNEDCEYEIQFLKRLAKREVFIFDGNKPYAVPHEDILFKLPQPTKSGTSCRLQGQFKFNISFDSFNIF